MTLEEIVNQAGGKFPIEVINISHGQRAWIAAVSPFSTDFIVERADGELEHIEKDSEVFCIPPKKKKQLWLHVLSGNGVTATSTHWLTDEEAKRTLGARYISRDPNCLIPLEVEDDE